MVKKPMDLGTIARNLMTRKYKKASQCVYDIQQMFRNWYDIYDHVPTVSELDF